MRRLAPPEHNYRMLAASEPSVQPTAVEPNDLAKDQKSLADKELPEFLDDEAHPEKPSLVEAPDLDQEEKSLSDEEFLKFLDELIDEAYAEEQSPVEPRDPPRERKRRGWESLEVLGELMKETQHNTSDDHSDVLPPYLQEIGRWMKEDASRKLEKARRDLMMSPRHESRSRPAKMSGGGPTNPVRKAKFSPQLPPIREAPEVSASRYAATVPAGNPAERTKFSPQLPSISESPGVSASGDATRMGKALAQPSASRQMERDRGRSGLGD